MIISASRRTDIPAFFSEWFINRIKEGYVIVRNSKYERQLSKVSLAPELVDCIVFWTKNPIPMISKLDELKDYKYYFQFTLTGYGKDIEPNLPDKMDQLVPAFQQLSKKIGPERVIWRYDPILLNEKYNIEWHYQMVEDLAGRLNGYTEKCVFSYLDFYDKIKSNVSKIGVVPFTVDDMKNLAIHIRNVSKANGMTCATCAEYIDLSGLGIDHNACIDKTLVERICGGKIKDTKKNSKDTAQRVECKCMPSREVAKYNTCSHGCVYCYANYSPESVRKALEAYDVNSPLLCDKLGPGDEVKESPDQKKLVMVDGQMLLDDIIRSMQNN